AQYRIDRLDTVRVLADPLRLRLLEAMAGQLDHPWSVKELARALGEPPTKLYYHVNLLEEHGLLVVTGSQLVSGILEKRYQPVAANIAVDRALLTAGDTGVDEALHSILTTIFSTAEQDIQAAVRSGVGSLHAGDEGDRERIVLSKGLDRLTPAQAEAFRQRLQALIAEFGSAPDGTDVAKSDGRLHGLVIAFYPMVEPLSPKTRRPRAARTPKEPTR
ncbi:MAG TPA: helix-turn-helix domain-containing protein, partial [Candidatus Limnocylindrales bacterium]